MEIFGKIWEKHRVKSWEKYGKSLEKYWKKMENNGK